MIVKNITTRYLHLSSPDITLGPNEIGEIDDRFIHNDDISRVIKKDWLIVIDYDDNIDSVVAEEELKQSSFGIKGAVNLYSGLPDPTTLHTGIIYIVKEGLSAPNGSGLYWVKDNGNGNVWEFLYGLQSSIAEFSWLRPITTDPVSDKIRILPGKYYDPLDPDKPVLLHSGGISSAFQTIITNPRNDLVVINAIGNINIIQGVESVSPVIPVRPVDSVVIAVVYIDETAIVSVSDTDIIDARKILGGDVPRFIECGFFV